MNTEQSTNQMINSAKKVLALPAKTPIYFYAGHGEDLCGDTNHKPIIRKVPDNCIYITITECGQFADIVLEDNPREKLFRNTTTMKKNLLRYPFVAGHKKKLAKLFELSSPSSIHIHYPGMEYVESFFQPAAFWDQGDEGQWNNAASAAFVFTRSGLLDKKKMEANPKPYKEVVSESADSFYITKNELVKFYADSVHPTPAFVNDILEATFPEKYALEGEDIQMFIETLVDKMENQLTNTYMMEKFPGIHYNMVCRSVEESCDEEAQSRRTTSTYQEDQREQKEIKQYLTAHTVLNTNVRKPKKQQTRGKQPPRNRTSKRKN